jgi:hypothetical protein
MFLPGKNSSARLQRISEAVKDPIAAWSEGISLRDEFGKSVDALILQDATARWKLE